MGGQNIMYEMQTDNKEESIKENPIIMKDGLFAVEIADEIPPLDHVKFLDEAGQFRDAKPHTKEDLAYYWRSKQRTVSIIMAISSFGMLIIMLSATTKYTSALWDFMVFCFTFVITFIIGFIPEGAFAWIPF